MESISRNGSIAFCLCYVIIIISLEAMDVSRSNEFYMRIECAREEVFDVEQQLQSTRSDIKAVMAAAEQLTVEACALGLRHEELEKDEAALAQSEAIAVQNKVLAEKKLMEVGGYECVVRILRKTLQKAKLEIMDTEGGRAVSSVYTQKQHRH